MEESVKFKKMYLKLFNAVTDALEEKDREKSDEILKKHNATVKKSILRKTDKEPHRSEPVRFLFLGSLFSLTSRIGNAILIKQFLN